MEEDIKDDKDEDEKDDRREEEQPAISKKKL
jgi:hypothetical protein